MNLAVAAARAIPAWRNRTAAKFRALPRERQSMILWAVALTLTVSVSMIVPDPAYAQNLQGFADKVLGLLSNGLLRTLAIIAVILVGLGWMTGRVNTGTLVTVLIAITIVFSAPFIVDTIAG
jgi:type IV secretory pathway VirB2 component (pilin)